MGTASNMAILVMQLYPCRPAVVKQCQLLHLLATYP